MDEIVVIYRPWFRHWKTGQIVYPKNGSKVVRIELSREDYVRYFVGKGKEPSRN